MNTRHARHHDTLAAVTAQDMAYRAAHPGVSQYVRGWVAGEYAALVALGQAGFADGRVNERDHCVSVTWAHGPYPMRAAIRRRGPSAGKALRPLAVW